MIDKYKLQSVTTIHASAALGFQAASTAYDRGRPSYPPESVAWLISSLKISGSSTVADLGAGTGKFTSLFADRCDRILAIEPVEGMRRRFVQSHMGIPLLAGKAEAIPLARRSVDAVVCAQAFHWFDAPRVLEEIHRILKPDGRLGLIWNVRDESVPWMAKLTAIVDVYAGNTPRYRDGKWREAFEQSTLFTPLQEAHFQHAQRGSVETVLDRVASISFIAALPDSKRNDVLAKVRELLSRDVLTQGADEIEFPYVTHALWCKKLEG